MAKTVADIPPNDDPDLDPNHDPAPAPDHDPIKICRLELLAALIAATRVPLETNPTELGHRHDEDERDADLDGEPQHSLRGAVADHEADRGDEHDRDARVVSDMPQRGLCPRSADLAD